MTRTLLLTTAALFMLTAGGAVAQQSTTTTTTPAQKPAEMQSHGTQSGQHAGMKLEDMVGRDVYGEDGRELGEISDIVLNADNKQPNVAVVESGGFLGLGTKRIGIDYTLLEMNNDRFIAKSITQDQVDAMPEFEYSDSIVSLNRSADRSKAGDAPQKKE